MHNTPNKLEKKGIIMKASGKLPSGGEFLGMNLSRWIQ